MYSTRATVQLSTLLGKLNATDIAAAIRGYWIASQLPPYSPQEQPAGEFQQWKGSETGIPNSYGLLFSGEIRGIILHYLNNHVMLQVAFSSRFFGCH
jgi:hypothetical protein